MENDKENTVGKVDSSSGVETPKPKRKRGRPKGSTNKTKTKTKTVSENSAQIDSSIFSETVKSLLGLVDERLEKSNYKIALRITGDEKFSRNIANEGRFTNTEIKTLQDATTRLAAKYGFLGKFGDEVILGAVFVSYSYRQLSVKSELTKIAKRIHAANLTQQKANGNPTEQN